MGLLAPRLENAMDRMKIRLVAGLFGALAVTATAHAAGPRNAPPPENEAAAASGAEADQARPADAYCLRSTGTRIVRRTPARTDARRPPACSSGVYGRAYSRDDLGRTGEVTVAEALRKLDPSIR